MRAHPVHRESIYEALKSGQLLGTITIGDEDDDEDSDEETDGASEGPSDDEAYDEWYENHSATKDTALLAAVKADDLRALKRLAKKYRYSQMGYGDIFGDDCPGFENAARHGAEKIVRYLTSRHGFCAASPGGWSDCEGHNAEAVPHLCGFCPSRRLYEGESPLHEAVAAGHVRMVRLLIDMGANVDHYNKWGATPLQRVTFELRSARGWRRGKRELAAISGAGSSAMGKALIDMAPDVGNIPPMERAMATGKDYINEHEAQQLSKNDCHLACLCLLLHCKASLRTEYCPTQGGRGEAIARYLHEVRPPRQPAL
jgi:hypothetical protein